MRRKDHFSGIHRRTVLSGLALLPALSAMLQGGSAAAQPAPAAALPSWNDGPAKASLIEFVAAVTREGAASYVPVPKRIAVFDNDGTLWCEQPMYVQFAFALHRVEAMAPQYPDWKDKEPFKAALARDLQAIGESGERGMVELVTATHAGMTNEEFEQIVKDWLSSARHPRFKRPYTALVYQPMIELLAYLRAHGFKAFTVSGGGIEFMRPWSEPVYGVPPEQVVGSSIKTKFVMRHGRPTLFRLPEVDFVNDGPGKPVGINEHIGRRPILAFGNSDGDLEMLQWTTMGGGPGLGLILHHTDAEREYAYDRRAHFGRLDKALDVAPTNGWTVVDMKTAWKRVFAFQ